MKSSKTSQNAKKLVLSKETVRNLKLATGIQAGAYTLACSKPRLESVACNTY